MIGRAGCIGPEHPVPHAFATAPPGTPGTVAVSLAKVCDTGVAPLRSSAMTADLYAWIECTPIHAAQVEDFNQEETRLYQIMLAKVYRGRSGSGSTLRASPGTAVCPLLAGPGKVTLPAAM